MSNTLYRYITSEDTTKHPLLIIWLTTPSMTVFIINQFVDTMTDNINN